MAKNISLLLELLKRRATCRKVVLPYKQARDSRLRLTDEDKVKIQGLMDIAHELLSKTAFDINISSSNLIRISAFTIGNIKFDIHAGTKSMLKIVDQSGIKGGKARLTKIFEDEHKTEL